MHKLIEMNKKEIRLLCEKYGLIKLEIFGSAAGDQINTPGDFDFLVEFKQMKPVEYFESYFSFKEELEHLLKKPVDLVEIKEISNPYFLKEIENHRIELYAA
jgi:uncharacterized protein